MGTGHTYLDNGAIIIGRDSRRGQDLCDDQRGRHWPQLGSGSPLHVWPEPAAQSVLNPGLRKQAPAGGFSRVVGTSGKPRAETRAVTPFGDDTAGAPIIVSARLVCSLANEDAAAASIKEFDGLSSVVADDRSYRVFGDSLLRRKRAGYLVANAVV